MGGAEDKLVRVIPLVEEANLMATELKRCAPCAGVRVCAAMQHCARCRKQRAQCQTEMHAHTSTQPYNDSCR